MMIQLLCLISMVAIDYGASIKLTPRVVGGRLAEPGEVPYQVALQDIARKKHFCGGVIINEYYVVTAAHCIYWEDILDIAVSAGTIDLREPHSVHLAVLGHVHERYDPEDFTDRYNYDIALVKVQTPFVFSFLIYPANLPKQDEFVEPGSTALISGFGVITYPGGKRTEQLYIVDNIIVNQTYCNKIYKDLIDLEIHDSQICSIHPTEQKGVCFGDSGGPLTVNGKLVGLVSFAYDCGSNKYPTVYTRVPSYINWINEQIKIDKKH
ncbi:PREDICTED: mite allergen Eur m 3-like [Cyphomyrmex costatus]|uniref:mite allergen Eur m 3-like n=1 Tax=Cyphomyrmex costatus TaxID=456900 RepID=UPI0008523328|nr:PREDICTED: mite allergen Eur m 3-like [Cyphomyrmex costatus]